MEVQAHILPAAILVECWMTQEMTDSLNDYLDDLLKRKDRISKRRDLCCDGGTSIFNISRIQFI